MIKSKKILYVDDEILNLQGFKYSFFDEYDIFTAQNPNQGLEILEKEEIKIVISDQRMPEMSGLEFLRIVNEKYPDIICIILTAHIDVEISIQAVNQGGIYRFLTKPWDSNEMRNTVDSALELFDLRKNRKELLSNLEEKNKELQAYNEKLLTMSASLAASEEKFRRLSNLTFEGIIIHEQGRIIDVNQSFCSLFGYRKHELIGKTVPELLHVPEDQFILPPITNDETILYESIIVTKGGAMIPVEIIAKNIFFGNENKTYRVAAIRDIIQRKIAEKEKRESEEKFKNIFDAGSEGIIITDLYGKILEVNKIVTERLGQSREKMLEKRAFDFIHPGMHDKFARLYQKARLNPHNINEQAETEYINKHGEKVYLELSASPILYEGKNAVLIFSRNVTDRKNTEQKILNAIIEAEEKERERFSADIHDGIGPLMSTVKMYFQWLGETDDAAKKKMIYENGKAGIDETISALREISNNLSPRTLNRYGIVSAIGTFISRIGEVSGLNIGFNHNFDQRFDSKIEITLYRIITELINNTLKHAGADKSNINLMFFPENKMFELTYEDNGKGFDFENEQEKLSGHGISNITRRIKTLGGEINVLKPEKGIKIVITLKETGPK